MNPVIFAILTGLGIGALGSFHCVGMCGPIALALPVGGKSPLEKTFSILLYNLGRASSYALMGLIFGLIGSTFSVFGWQQWLSVVAGVVILLLLAFNHISLVQKTPFRKWNQWVKNQLSRILQSEKKPFTYLSLGLLNGWLPCGLVYVAIASSLATGSLWGGALLMFAFGLGTIPVMAGLIVFGQLISLKVRAGINKAVPYLIAGMAVLLILRGLNLGIPYLSPSYNAEEDCVENCCKPE
jgi:sulfite exporter TauE/SafE